MQRPNRKKDTNLGAEQIRSQNQPNNHKVETQNKTEKRLLLIRSSWSTEQNQTVAVKTSKSLLNPSHLNSNSRESKGKNKELMHGRK